MFSLHSVIYTARHKTGALTDWEVTNRESYRSLHNAHISEPPEDDPALIWALGQTCGTWGRQTDGSRAVIPTYTGGGTVRLYSARERRWIAFKEKFASMLFPVYPEHAARAGCKVYTVPPECRPHERVGNSMHVGNATIILTCLVACIEAKDVPNENGGELQESAEATATQIMNADADDPYSVLGLPHSSDIAGVKKQYRNLSKLVHPDKAKALGPVVFQKLHDAYETLLDPDKKQEIDKKNTQKGRRGRPAKSAPSTGVAAGAGKRGRPRKSAQDTQASTDKNTGEMPGETDAAKSGINLPEGKNVTYSQFRGAPGVPPAWLPKLHSSTMVIPA